MIKCNRLQLVTGRLLPSAGQGRYGVFSMIAAQRPPLTTAMLDRTSVSHLSDTSGVLCLCVSACEVKPVISVFVLTFKSAQLVSDARRLPWS